VILVLILGVVAAGLAVALTVRALVAARFRPQLVAQVAAYGFDAQAPNDETARPHLGELLRRFANWLGTQFEAQLDEERRERARLLLNSAGFYRTSVTRYVGYRVLSVIGPPLALVLFSGLTGSFSAGVVVALIALVGIGWIGPSFYLHRRAAERIRKIDYEMPELVDLLVTTVEAGVGFVAALQLAARRVREPVAQELRLTLREHGMGLALDEALQHLSERSASTNLRMFVQAILQGETLGVSIGKILRDLAVDMRKRRRQMAEERAQKAPIKLLFPLAVLILPAMFIVILAPTLYAVARQLGG
jgi:tight adherence protein C